MSLPHTDPSSRLVTLIGKAEVRLRNALLNAVNAARDELTLDVLTKLIEAGAYEEALEAAARRGAVALSNSYAAVYNIAGAGAGAALSEALEVVVDFDQVNERAVEQLRQQRLDKIRGFSAEQRTVTRNALVDGTTRGIGPREQARLFRDSIGLTDRQRAAVANYRRLLEEGSSESLSRELRNRGDDRMVRRAIREGRSLTPEQVDRMSEAYSKRYLKYRSEVIARTEALRAVHQGTDEAYRQAIDNGLVTSDQLQRTWVTARDERVRNSHDALNGETRGIDETWGVLRYPGDPAAPPSETVQCRCALSTRIVGPLDGE